MGDGDRAGGLRRAGYPVFLKVSQDGAVLGYVKAEAKLPKSDRVPWHGVLYQPDRHGGGPDHYE